MILQQNSPGILCSVLSLCSSLTIGYKRIINDSRAIGDDELMRVRFDDEVQDKLDANVFPSLFLTLADMSETGSKESQEREAKKRRQTDVIVDTSVSYSIPEEISSSEPITTL